MSKPETGAQWGAYGSHRKKRQPKVKQRTCLAHHCATLIDGDSFMCRAHWNKVPDPVQAGMRLSLREERQADFDEYLHRARSACLGEAS